MTYKEIQGLDRFTPLNENKVIEDLNNPDAKQLLFELAEKELCLVKDDQKWVPIKQHSEKKIALLAIGDGRETEFQKEFKKYGDFKLFQISKNAGSSEFSAMYTKLRSYDIAIVSVHNTSKYPSKYGLTTNEIQFMNTATAHSGLVTVYFGNPYGLNKFKTQPTVLLAYEDEEAQNIKAAQALWGHNYNEC